MNLYIGLKIRTIDNDLAEIVGIQGQNVKLLYKGKIYTLNKYLINRINKKWFVLDNKIENKKNVEQSCLNRKTCNNCMEMKKGECIGDKSISNDYRPSPEISKDELDRWPKVGDASFYRFYRYF